MAADPLASGQARRRRAAYRHAVAAVMTVFAPLVLAQAWFGLHGRKTMAALVALCLSLAPLPLASAHDPLTLSAAEAARHAVLMAQDVAEHGHSHDDGAAQEQSPGHLHGHDPADHSHQAAFFAGTSSDWVLPASQRWPSQMADLPEPAAGFGIERPPRRLPSL